jgi:hypothetical protein
MALRDGVGCPCNRAKKLVPPLDIFKSTEKTGIGSGLHPSGGLAGGRVCPQHTLESEARPRLLTGW